MQGLLRRGDVLQPEVLEVSLASGGRWCQPLWPFRPRGFPVRGPRPTHEGLHKRRVTGLQGRN
jgi:hypothetical protein